jgi:hypothetical protein
VQAEELYEHQEQEDQDGAAGIQEVLRLLPETPAAQRD